MNGHDNNSNSTLQPPVPFADFEYSFDPALSGLFPAPPPLPSSADLFTPSETTDLLGFLDEFNWEFDQDPAFSDPYNHHSFQPGSRPDLSPVSHAHHDTLPALQYPQPHTLPRPENLSPVNMEDHAQMSQPPPSVPDVPHADAAATSELKRRGSSSTPRGNTRGKPLLSTPQKRLNHIMSEQKRRNAIRDGYAQLISLLAPAGAPGINMPSRGRPKGSGSRGKSGSKGKSGVLFRAVEYCRWLEEGRDALREEVLRLEAAAGIHSRS